MEKAIIDKQGQLKTHAKEYVKTYQEFDLSGRVTRVITARHDAPAGEIAVATLFTYVGSTTRVAFMLEYEILWDAAWDLAVFPVDAINTGRIG